MQVDNPIRLVRELKGAPISIILVLSFSTLRVTQEWLERATGYTDKPVSQALQYLREIGLVDHTRSGWQLTGEGKQLPLGLALEESTTETPCENRGTAQSDTEILEEMPEEVSRNISDSITTTTIKDSKLRVKGSSKYCNGDPSRNFSDSELKTALESAGIKGVKLKALLSRGGIRPVDVVAWEAELRERYGGRYRPGLLVHVLESGDPAPERRENGHKPGCHCYECFKLQNRQDREDDDEYEET